MVNQLLYMLGQVRDIGFALFFTVFFLPSRIRI
jgi:hypothetical protein